MTLRLRRVSVQRAKYTDVSSRDGGEFGAVERVKTNLSEKLIFFKKVWFSNIVDSDLARESKLRGEVLSRKVGIAIHLSLCKV